jgi:hypothetical protein
MLKKQKQKKRNKTRKKKKLVLRIRKEETFFLGSSAQSREEGGPLRTSTSKLAFKVVICSSPDLAMPLFVALEASPLGVRFVITNCTVRVTFFSEASSTEKGGKSNRKK